jgi:hypothetical protein
MIFKWFRNRALKKLAAENAYHQKYQGFAASQKIGIFLDGLAGQEAAAALFRKHFTEEEKKEITILSYLPVKSKEVAQDYPYYRLAKNNKNWWGVPNSEGMLKFVEQDYDLVFDFTQLNLEAHHFVRAQLKCAFYVAFGKNASDAADLKIDVNPAQNTASALSQCLKYLKLINSTKNG